MSDTDLRDLLREHVARDEPAFLLDPRDAVVAGSRSRRRRTAFAAGGSLLAVAAATAAVVGLTGLPTLPGGDGGTATGTDPQTASALRDYDASAMPVLLDDRAGGVLRRSVPGLGEPSFAARDSQGQRIPEKWWDKASAMGVEYGTRDHSWGVSLSHARSEAEGSKREYCADALASGYAFRCEVTTSEAGDTVVTEVWAARPLGPGDPGLGALTRGEIETGELLPGNPSRRPIDPGEILFTQSVEVVHSETFLTRAEETVQAPELDLADRMWRVPTADLAEIATDPLLVIPEPPIGEGNCPWTLPGTGVACSTTD